MPEETLFRIDGRRAFVRIRGAKELGLPNNRWYLPENTVLSICPVPNMWLDGTYHYDAERNEHYWKYHPAYFVGLIDGMCVRVRVEGDDATT